MVIALFSSRAAAAWMWAYIYLSHGIRDVSTCRCAVLPVAMVDGWWACERGKGERGASSVRGFGSLCYGGAAVGDATPRPSKNPLGCGNPKMSL